LLPAVQAAREAARRTQCGNNLKQLGLALHQYHGPHRRFPMGAVHGACSTWGSVDPEHKGSFLVGLLPYMEQNALYEACDFTTNTSHYSQVGGVYVHETWIPTLICPSDDGQEYWDGNPLYHGSPASTQGQKRATSNYAASMGNQAFGAGSFGCPYTGNDFVDGAGNPRNLGVSGHGHDNTGMKISGVFSHCAWGAAIRDVTDGTSKTIALGEIRPKCSLHARDGWMHINALWFATTCPINWKNCEGEPGFEDPTCNPRVSSGWNWAWGCDMGFKSRHPGGAQFLFVDGSTHFLEETIDYMVYQRLGDRRDGEPIGDY
jgi:prepilin-type processing-associated H-X9-DG protein